MKPSFQFPGERTRPACRSRRPAGYIAAFILLLIISIAHLSPAATDPDHTSTPLQLYNDGTKRLADGKLQEAEACLQGAIASQDERIQPPALYNLGEVRFREGAEDYKKGPQSQHTAAASDHALNTGTDALKSLDAALVSDEVQTMLSAYLQGRGARKELKAALAAVKQAMGIYGNVLTKWQRAAGDFKSSHELLPADLDSKTNADIVDRCIAKLIDRQQLMAQAMQGMMKMRGDIGKKMAALKQKMPDDGSGKMTGKGDDDDDDDEKNPKGPKEDDKEPGPKDGKQMQLTQEEAVRLLDMLKLDGNRKLAMGTNELGKPKDHKGRDW